MRRSGSSTARCEASTPRCNALTCILNGIAPRQLRFPRQKSPLFPGVGRRGSRCRRTGMAPELPGSRRTCPSTRGENLMRRASTCLALLGLAVLGLTGVASAAPTVTFKAKAVPIPGLPGHRQHPRRRRRGRSRIHDQRHRIRRLPAAAHRRQLLPAGRHEDQPDRLPDLPAGDARKDRSERLPEEVAGQPGRRQRRRRRSVRRRTRRRERDAAGVLRARRRPPVLRRRGTRRSSLELLVAKAHYINRRWRAFGLEFIDRSAAGRRRFPAPRRVDRIDQRQGRRRVQEGQEDDLLRHAADEVPERRLPGEVRNDFANRRNLVRAVTTTRRRAPRSNAD